MPNPFIGLNGTDAIKRAYRILAKQCHPDLRQDKEAAAIEFRELTKIYEEALKNSGAPQKRSQHQWSPGPPPQKPPPPKPAKDVVHRAVVDKIDDYEFIHFGEAERLVRAPVTLFEYGGTVQVCSRYMDYFQFYVPPKTKTGQRFRFQLPIGIVEIQLVKDG